MQLKLRAKKGRRGRPNTLCILLPFARRWITLVLAALCHTMYTVHGQWLTKVLYQLKLNVYHQNGILPAHFKMGFALLQIPLGIFELPKIICKHGPQFSTDPIMGPIILPRNSK